MSGDKVWFAIETKSSYSWTSILIPIPHLYKNHIVSHFSQAKYCTDCPLQIYLCNENLLNGPAITTYCYLAHNLFLVIFILLWQQQIQQIDASNSLVKAIVKAKQRCLLVTKHLFKEKKRLIIVLGLLTPGYLCGNEELFPYCYYFR